MIVSNLFVNNILLNIIKFVVIESVLVRDTSEQSVDIVISMFDIVCIS